MNATVLGKKVFGFTTNYGEGIVAVGLFVVVAGWLIRMISAMPYEIQ